MENIIFAAIEKYIASHPEVIEKLVEGLINILIRRLNAPPANA